MEENIFCELLDRLRKPWKKTSFTLYFIFVVIIFGGIGVLMSLFLNKTTSNSEWVSNLMTYSITLSIPACITIILQYVPKANNKVSLVLLCISLLIIQIIVICIFYFLSNGALLIAIGSTILSWIFWVIANSDNEYLDDKTYSQIIKDDIKKNHGQDWN